MSNHLPSKYKSFSLFHGDTIHLSPKAKIISGEEISQLLEGKELLERVHDDAEQYRLEVTKECELLKEEAKKEGFTAGFAVWAQQIAYAEEMFRQAQKELEKVLATAAIKAAKRIVGREIELSEETIVDIVANSLKTVSQHKKITIYVNRKSKEILDKHRKRLKEIFEQLEILSIQEREDLSDGGCIIETEKGIINARIEAQWEILEKAFRGLIKQ